MMLEAFTSDPDRLARFEREAEGFVPAVLGGYTFSLPSGGVTMREVCLVGASVSVQNRWAIPSVSCSWAAGT